jgi:hypothetical protein
MVTRSRARPGRRAGERGATVFIVVLVLTMLTAIGVFAAGAATLSTVASGHQRQMTQTRYLTEYAASLVLADLAKAGGLTESDAAKLQATQGGYAPACSSRTNYCFAYMPSRLEDQAMQDIVVPSAPGVPGTPGSLGLADIDWKFKVELVDKYPAVTPPEGSDISNSKTVDIDYWTVVVSARGIIWPKAAGLEDAAIGAAGHQDAMTAYITLPSKR